MPDSSFDLVLATEVLEHLERPDVAVRECERVSRKYCIFTVPNEPFFRIANVLRLKYLKSFGNTPGHLQNFTIGKFRALLDSQFREVRIINAIFWNIAVCRK